jgi:hypothetical protein
MYKNLKILLSSWKRTTIYILLVLIALWVWWSFTDIGIMFGNYGKLHTYSDIFLSSIMILGFPLFIIAIIYRSWKFGKKENLNKKTGVWLLSGIIGTLISWASCCGLTLASYVGLIPLMTLLPYDGLEIKLVWTIGLLYALWSILTELESCKVRR